MNVPFAFEIGGGGETRVIVGRRSTKCIIGLKSHCRNHHIGRPCICDTNLMRWQHHRAGWPFTLIAPNQVSAISFAAET